jgi:YVTN family beta-propeller protein
MIRGGQVLLTASLVLFSAASAAAQAPSYHLAKSIVLGSPERWDYVIYDKTANRVFVAHGDRVAVVDAKSGAVLGQVEGIPGGTHGTVAVNGKGYTDDGEAGQAIVFDLKTFKVLKRIKAQDDADGIAFDSTSGHIFVIEGDSKSISVIDPKNDQVIDTIQTGGGLEAAVSGENGKLYVNGSEKKEMIRIDTASNKVDAHWPIPDCTSPHGLAIDTQAQSSPPSLSARAPTALRSTPSASSSSAPMAWMAPSA